MKKDLMKMLFYAVVMGLVYGFANHLKYIVNDVHKTFWEIVVIYAKCVAVVVGTLAALAGLLYLFFRKK